MKEKITAPMTSKTECLLASTRPVATREARMNITISMQKMAVFDLVYLGRAALMQKKIVVTNMT